MFYQNIGEHYEGLSDWDDYQTYNSELKIENKRKIYDYFIYL